MWGREMKNPGLGATTLGRRGLAFTEVGRLWEGQVGREGQDLLSDKLQSRCL